MGCDSDTTVQEFGLIWRGIGSYSIEQECDITHITEQECGSMTIEQDFDLVGDESESDSVARDYHLTRHDTNLSLGLESLAWDMTGEGMLVWGMAELGTADTFKH